MKGSATVLCAAVATLWLAACDEGKPQSAIADDAAVGGNPDATALPDDFFKAKAPAFASSDDEPKTVQVSASGEALAQMGFTYNSAPAGDPVFVDGWELSFERYLVVIDRVLVSQPGPDPDKRGQVGATVVEQRGPWVVDLHKRGPLIGAGGPPETAVPLTVLRADFDTARGYAFSYQTAPASYAVRNTNLIDSDRDALQQMIDHGWVKYIAGTARYRGRAPSDSVDATFRDYPTQVHFAFGIADPAEYVNCHNPEIGEQDEPANRGVRPSADGSVRAQLTFHTDHFFWDQADVEGTPLRFDALAARADGFGTDIEGRHELQLDQLAGVKPSALADASGMPVRDRGAQTNGYHPDPGAPPVYASNGVAEIDDLRSFVVYNNRGQGHLNSDGLCLVMPSAELSF